MENAGPYSRVTVCLGVFNYVALSSVDKPKLAVFLIDPIRINCFSP